MRYLSFLVALVLLFPAYAGAAERGPFMTLTGLTAMPLSYFEFCRRHSNECSVVTKGDPRVKLTQALWNQLLSVNDGVNVAIKQVTEPVDFWDYPVTQGDCEDFALLKRRMLIEKGWPVGALLITVAYRLVGVNWEGHAVLTVLTNQGDYILDQVVPSIRLWSETPYVYMKRQSSENTAQWDGIADPRVASITTSSIR